MFRELLQPKKMPSSYPENIPKIIHLVAKFKPKSVLDVGIGRGKYGFLLKEYFENASGEWEPIEKIDGLEVFPEYVTDLQRLCYDEIHIGNALEYEYPKYDMYLLIDVLEHWPKEQAFKVLDDLTKKGLVLISTPTNIGNQGAVHGNEWECHVSQWLPPDFEKYTRLEDWSDETSFIYVLKR